MAQKDNKVLTSEEFKEEVKRLTGQVTHDVQKTIFYTHRKPPVSPHWGIGLIRHCIEDIQFSDRELGEALTSLVKEGILEIVVLKDRIYFNDAR